MTENFQGKFVTDASIIQYKLKNIKAFLFDWDGVFNDGRKDINGNSSFSEIDSMGINMMRYSYYLLHQQLPSSIIITGESNKLAMHFAKREHFNAVYYKTPHKHLALLHACEQYNLKEEEVLFVFDDVLDFSVAKLAGIRCMIGREANKELIYFSITNNLVDYLTKHDGNNNAVREVSEMIMLLSNNFDNTIENRMNFSDSYQQYLQLRQKITTEFFITKEHAIVKEMQ